MRSDKQVRHEDFLFERLKDDQYAIDYLNACFENEDQVVFLCAICDVIKARNINMNQIAQDAQLIKVLSDKSDLSLKSLRLLIKSMGFRLQIIST